MANILDYKADFVTPDNIYEAWQKHNNLIDKLNSTTIDEGASMIAIESISGITGSDVQAALVDLQDDKAEKSDLQATTGSILVGFDGDTFKSGWPAIHTVNHALQELTYFSANKGASLIGVQVNTGFSSTDVQGALEELQSFVTPAITSSSIKLEYGAVSGASAELPTNSGGIRIHALDDCLINFGDNTVTASAADSIYMAAGSESFGPPSTATHIAVKGLGSPGAITITGINNSYKFTYTTNTVLPVQGGSSNIELPSTSTRVRLFSMTDCFINFGDNTVTASDSDMFFEAGTEVLNIPADATHIAAVRYSLNGGLYISGIE
jgi:hypothetical protein